MSRHVGGPAPGRPYTQLLRGPGHRWWRSLLSLLVVVSACLAIGLAVSGALVVATLAGAFDASAAAAGAGDPWVLLSTNLLLAAGTGVAVLAVRVGHGYRPGFESSVVGRLRWRWMLRCAGVALLLAVVTTAALWLADGAPGGRGTDVVLLLAIVALTTPLQAAGEEYFFRGWLSQSVGALFGRAVVGAAVAAAVSAALFALAHGGQNLFLFADRFAFGLLASYLAWRTGGLEAGIAAHTVNNVVVFVPVILTGGLSTALTVSESGPVVTVVDIAGMVVLGVALAWLARRAGLRRRYVPPAGEAPLLATPAPSGSVHPR